MDRALSSGPLPAGPRPRLGPRARARPRPSFDAPLIGGVVLLGTRAVRGHAWAFLVGVSLYGLDALISLLAHDWLGLGFHVFVVIMILRGFQAARHLAARAT